MATNFIGVLLPNTPNYIVGTGFSTQLYDATGAHLITVESGASLQLTGSLGNNILRLPGKTSAWQVYRDGSTVVLTSTDSSRIELPATTDIQTLQFDDGDRALQIVISGGSPALKLGTQTLTAQATVIAAVEATPPTNPDPGEGSTTKTPWTLVMQGAGSGFGERELLVSDGSAAGTETKIINGLGFEKQLEFKINADQTGAYFYNPAGFYYNSGMVGYTDGTLAGTQSIVRNAAVPSNFVSLANNQLVLAGSNKAYAINGPQKTYTSTDLDYSFSGGLHDEANQTIWSYGYSSPYGQELVNFDYSNPNQITSGMVKDINPGSSSGLDSLGAILPNGKLVFSANDGIHGSEAWVSDGTETGTFMLKDNYLGNYGNFSYFKAYGDKVAFTVYASGGAISDAGRELAFTDGTREGTTLLDINPGWDGSNPNILGEANGLLYFTASARNANSGNTENGIYSTNGTTFTKLATIQSDASLLGWDSNLAFFRVSDATHGTELWVANFSTNRFSMVKDILEGSGSALADANNSSANAPQMVAGKLIFTAYTSGTKQGLFVSDGSAAGTVQVGNSAPTQSKVIGNTLVFANAEGVFSVNLAAGQPSAVQLSSVGLSTSNTSLQTDADQIFYLTRSGDLFSTTGATAPAAPLARQVSQFKVVAEDAVFFIQSNTANSTQSLWYSDGTATGTRFIEDLPSGSAFDLDNAVAIRTAGEPLPPDTVAPLFRSARVNGDQLTLHFSDASALDATHLPEANAFTLGGTSATVSSVAVDAAAKTVTLTLSEAVKSTDSITLSYSDPTTGNDPAAIQDAAGNDAASLSNRFVTNQTPDNVAPVFGSASVNGATLTLTYSDASLLDATNKPAASAFALDGTTATVSNVAVDAAAKTVTLTLSEAVKSTETVTVSYTDPSANNDEAAIQDAAGNDAASFSNRFVTHQTPDNVAPVFTRSPVFADKVDYSTGYSTTSVASADVNGDGKADLLVASGSGVSVLTNIGDGRFNPKVDYATGSDPSSVASADVNGDGKADIVVANRGNNTVSVLTNRGDGTFNAKVDYATDAAPSSVSSADVNGDGKADIVVANANSNSLSVLTNQGDGTFNAKVSYLTGGAPSSVFSVDVNGDNQVDLLVTNRDSHSVSVLTNQGDGRFNAKVDVATGYYPRSVSSADVNGDGKADLLVANQGSNTVSVLTNQGDGTFNAKVDYATGSSPNSVSSADVNGDGKADLLAAGGNGVSVLTNQGDGRFNAKVDYATDYSPRSVSSADVNGDGKADLLVAASSWNNVVSVLINQDGLLVSATPQAPVHIGTALTLSDPDGDADWRGGSLQVQISANAEAADTLSLPTSNLQNGGIWVNPLGNLLMRGNTQVGTANATSVSNGSAWTFTFNDNASNDVVQSLVRAITFTHGSDTPASPLRMLTFTATDQLGASSSVDQPLKFNTAPTAVALTGTTTTLPEDTNTTNRIEVGTLAISDDGLGANTVTLSGADAGSFEVEGAKLYLKAGTALHYATQASYAVTVTVADNTLPGATPVSTRFTLAVSDVNDAPTYLGVPSSAQSVTVGVAAALANFTVSDPDGDDLTVTLTAINGAVGGLTDADANAAGIQLTGTASAINTALAGATFTATNAGAASVGISVTDGQATTTANYALQASAAAAAPVFTLPPQFAAQVAYATGSNPSSVTSADVNGDGKADLLVANYYSNTVSVLTNQGDGRFNAKVDVATGVNPTSVTSADVNGDGKADLLVANSSSNTVSVLTNQGDGRFNAKVDYATGRYPYSVTSADVNGDGKADLLVANSSSNTVSVLTNQGDGTFHAKVDYATGGTPISVSSADVNGDGKADLLVANQGSNTVSVLTNQGDGRFNAKVDYATDSSSQSVTSTDVNGDGKADLLVAVGNGVSVLTNQGDGRFNAKVDYYTGSSPQSVSSADVNGDGKADLLVANYYGTVSVLTNQGDGTFNAKVDVATGGNPTSVSSADVNGDGKADLLVAKNYGSNTVSVLTNQGSTTLLTAYTEQTPVAVAAGLVVSDPSGNADWDDGSLTVQIVTNAEAADRLSLPTSRPYNGGANIWVNPTTLALMAGDVQFGLANAAGASQDAAWTFTFNAKATNAWVTALVQAITFNNDSDAPGTGARQVGFTATDRGGLSASTTATISVTAVNDAPMLSGLAVDGAGITFTATDPDSSALKAFLGTTELASLTVNNGSATTLTTTEQTTTVLVGDLRVQDNAATPAATHANVYVALGTAGADNLSSLGSSKPAALYGFGGNDTLTGTSQADTLSGGDGADVFDYRSFTDSTLKAYQAPAYDQLTDFTTGQDQIKTGLTGGATSVQQGAAYTANSTYEGTSYLRSAIANAVAAGNTAGSHTKAANDVYVLTITGSNSNAGRYVFLDSNGDGSVADGELFIQLTGTSSATLALGDFVH